MARAIAHLCGHQRLHVGRALPVDQVPDVLLGGESDHDAEAVALRDVQERAWRHRMGDAHGVDAGRRHLAEVALHLREVLVLIPLGVGRERAVGDAADVELLVPDEQELPANVWPRRRLNGRRGEATIARAVRR